MPRDVDTAVVCIGTKHMEFGEANDHGHDQGRYGRDREEAGR